MTVTKWTPRGKRDASVKVESTDLLWYKTQCKRSITETNVMKKLAQKIHTICGQSTYVRHLLVVYIEEPVFQL